MTTGKQNSQSDLIVFDDIYNSCFIPEANAYIMYQDVIDCEIVEKKGTMGKGGIARAFSSDLFGGQVYITTSLCVEIMTTGEVFKIELIKTPLKSNSFIYKRLLVVANEIVDKINLIKPLLKEDTLIPNYINELRELKKLVDENILTEAEFQQKKQLLLKTK
jgi:hypothetical protein